ncbi:hypothetical protein ACTQ6A_13095 [Lachnospiraceae bacterium LCP25S3_G4]
MKRRKNTNIKMLLLALIIVVGGVTTGCKMNTAVEDKTKKKKSTGLSAEEQVEQAFEKKRQAGNLGIAAEDIKGKLEGTTYLSEEGNIQIILPDDSWHVTGEEGNTITFASEVGTISIMHVTGEELNNMPVPKTLEELVANVNGNDTDLGVQVLDFEYQGPTDGIEFEKGVFQYTSEVAEYKYGVSYAYKKNDTDLYLTSGMISLDDEGIMGTVRDAIFGVQILK